MEVCECKKKLDKSDELVRNLNHYLRHSLLLCELVKIFKEK